MRVLFCYETIIAKVQITKEGFLGTKTGIAFVNASHQEIVEQSRAALIIITIFQIIRYCFGTLQCCFVSRFTLLLRLSKF